MAHTDTIAERVAQLDGIALGTSQVVAAATTLPPYPTEIRAVPDHLKALIDRYAALSRAAREGIDTADEAGDADSADILTADEARDGGLVRSVHAPDELLPAAYALAERYTKNKSPVGIALTRQMVYRNSAQAHPMEAHKVDSLAMWWASVGDGKEGVAAFLEKREPNFTAKASELPRVFPA